MVPSLAAGNHVQTLQTHRATRHTGVQLGQRVERLTGDSRDPRPSRHIKRSDCLTEECGGRGWCFFFCGCGAAASSPSEVTCEWRMRGEGKRVKALTSGTNQST